MIKYYLWAACLILAISSCSKAKNEQEAVEGGYSISVLVKNSPLEDGWVYLEKITAQGPLKVDSVQTNAEGKAVLTGKLATPGYFVVNTYGKSRDFFPLYNDKISVEVENNGKENTAKLSGSDLIAQYDKLETMSTGMRARMQMIADSIRNTVKNPVEQEAKRAEFIRLQTFELVIFRSQVKEYLKTVRPSFISLYATQYFDMSTDFTYLDSLVRELKTKYEGNEYIVEFAELLQKSSKLAKGAMAPEISLAGMDEKPIALSSMRGKYILVDFWASWCGPCRRNNPSLVAMYNKLKGPNFEILGVSLDRDKKAWLDAVKKDNLAWPQISDLKYWDCQAAKDYEVSSIPTSFLIDPKGVIIGSNLTEAEVEAIVLNKN